MAILIPIPYLQPPAVIVNEAMDELGESSQIIGDINDGTPVSEAARRNYGQALRRLLRSAHWDFARNREKLLLLGNNTGSPSPLPVGVSSEVEPPFGYAYAWPTDAVQGRWMPWNPAGGQPTSSTGVPLTTGGTSPIEYSFQPGRFLVTSSSLYPVLQGAQDWSQYPDLQRTEGVGPIYRKIILTDCCNAHFVYTRLVTVIEEWDSLFRQAMVLMMALVLAPTAIKDPKIRTATRDRLVPILKNAIADARVASANEAGFPQSTDFEASFIRARNQGNWGWGTGAIGPGVGGSLIGSYTCGFEYMSWGGNVY